MKRFRTRVVCAMLFCLHVAFSGFSQDGVMQDGLHGDSGEELEVENGDPGDGDGSVPVDGGLSLLLAAGAAYGAYRLRKPEPNGVVDAMSD